jgi:DNA-binding HxlR family transcriptional regulator
MFTQTVRELEKDGLIHRTVYPEVPPRVDYTPTPEGQSLDSILKSLDTWGKERFML